jgi:hypothetical protein
VASNALIQHARTSLPSSSVDQNLHRKPPPPSLCLPCVPSVSPASFWLDHAFTLGDAGRGALLRGVARFLPRLRVLRRLRVQLAGRGVAQCVGWHLLLRLVAAALLTASLPRLPLQLALYRRNVLRVRRVPDRAGVASRAQGTPDSCGLLPHRLV